MTPLFSFFDTVISGVVLSFAENMLTQRRARILEQRRVVDIMGDTLFYDFREAII